MVAGDVYVFEENDIIGVAGGVRFQCVPKALLDTLLSPAKSKAANSDRPVPMQTSQVKQQNLSQTNSKTRAPMGPAKSPPAREIEVIKKERPTSNSQSKSLKIIADEVGYPIELDFSSTVFNDLLTIAHLKSHLRQFETVSESPADSGLLTPDMVVSDTSDLDYSDNEAMVEDLNEKDLEEITDNTDLATMGMDSLMNLSILGALREKTGLSMKPDLLVSNTSINMIETSLGLGEVKARATPTLDSSALRTPVLLPIPAQRAEKQFSISSFPPASSILLQGNLRTARHILFLLPDGSGSAASYAHIPDIAASELLVYGLNCPFMKTREDFTIGVPAVCQIYMAEIRRRQPNGPYMLGGWSVGGVLAYEMTRQFIRKGETVERLSLIDSPCPGKLEAPPSSFHRFCDRIGLLGKPRSKVPSWLLPHFASAVRELTNYSGSLRDAKGIDISKMPFTAAIWARNGIIHLDTDPKPDWDPAVPMPNSLD
ncbi:hypothetical protein ACEPPN_014769 [Leptodophora sp. 'Broadleaf-Isolate-01']